GSARSACSTWRGQSGSGRPGEGQAARKRQRQPRGQVDVRQPGGRDGELARTTSGKIMTGSGRPLRTAFAAGALLAAAAAPAAAQDLSVNFGPGAGLTERAIQLVALITVLSLAPSILVMVTSFTR